MSTTAASSSSSRSLGPVVKASGPPRGIYFNFLGFCVGAFRMRKKGNDLEIIGPDDSKQNQKEPKTKKYRRKKKIREKVKDMGYGATEEETKEDGVTGVDVNNDVGNNSDNSSDRNSMNSDVENARNVKVEDFTADDKTKEYVDVRIDVSEGDLGGATETRQLLPDRDSSVNQVEETERYNKMKHASGIPISENPQFKPTQSAMPSPPAYGVSQLDSIDLDDEWETDSEGDHLEMDKEKEGKKTPNEAKKAQDLSAALTGTLISILILAPLIAFLVYGIIFLHEDKDVCPGSPLWIYDVVFMCIFFPTPFVTQSYKWGLIIWSILFTALAVILYYPNLVCQELTHTGLYIWSLCAFWFLFAHIVISIIVFVVQIINAPKEQAVENILNEGSPLVQGRNRVRNIPTVVAPDVSPGNIRGGPLGV